MMKLVKPVILLVPLLLILGGCTYRNVGMLNDEVIKDLEAGIAKVDAMLEAERQAAWDGKVAEYQVAFQNDVARIGASNRTFAEKIEAYEATKTKLSAMLEQSAILLNERMKVRRQNRLQDFINAHKTASGIKEVLAVYVAPDWEAIASLVTKAKTLIFTGGL